jgi:hypothetical protein
MQHRLQGHYEDTPSSITDRNYGTHSAIARDGFESRICFQRRIAAADKANKKCLSTNMLMPRVTAPQSLWGYKPLIVSLIGIMVCYTDQRHDERFISVFI